MSNLVVYFSTPSFSPLLYYIFLLSSYRVIEKTANVKPEVQWGLVEGLEETEAKDHIMSLSPSLRTYLVVCHPRKVWSYSGWAVAVKSDTHEGQRSSVAFFHFSRCVRNKVLSSSSAISPPDDATEGIQFLLEILG